MALSFECMQYFARKPLDTADIVRDGDFTPTTPSKIPATIPLRETNRQLCGPSSVGRVQWRSATAGTHQQARQRAVAVPAGGSGPGHGAQSSAVAQQVLPPGPAPRTEDREGSDGPKAGGASVLDVASGLGLRSL